MKGIDHHCKFLSFLCADTFFYSARMRPMGNAGWVQGDHPSCYILAAHKISIYIVDHFITVYITMIVRCGNRLRMIIKQSRTKGADDKIVGFECLVDRRRLVYATC